MKQETATSIADLAKMFMLITYGWIKDCQNQEERDRYYERLGLIFDAYMSC